jgi:CPA2 family monovalent cation:H+ antiporter-2
MRDVSYVAVDNEAGVVKREHSAGRSVFYGDARQPDVLKSLGVGEAGLVIVTIDDFRVTEQVVSSLHRTFPKLDILARGDDLQRCQRLQVQGARLAVSENLEASIALAHAALEKVTGDDAENDAAIDRFRKAYYSDTNREVPDHFGE